MVGVAHQVPVLHANSTGRDGVLVRSVEQKGVVGQGAVGVVILIMDCPPSSTVLAGCRIPRDVQERPYLTRADD
jgi:hypothetical protein